MAQSVMEPRNVVCDISCFLSHELRKPFSLLLAGGPGFEPGLTGPEPVVLPLDDPPVFCNPT